MIRSQSKSQACEDKKLVADTGQTFTIARLPIRSSSRVCDWRLNPNGYAGIYSSTGHLDRLTKLPIMTQQQVFTLKVFLLSGVPISLKSRTKLPSAISCEVTYYVRLFFSILIIPIEFPKICRSIKYRCKIMSLDFCKIYRYNTKKNRVQQ